MRSWLVSTTNKSQNDRLAHAHMCMCVSRGTSSVAFVQRSEINNATMTTRTLTAPSQHAQLSQRDRAMSFEILSTAAQLYEQEQDWRYSKNTPKRLITPKFCNFPSERKTVPKSLTVSPSRPQSPQFWTYISRSRPVTRNPWDQDL